MNRYLTFSLVTSMTLSTLAIPLRAANKPRAGDMENKTAVWTNDDLEKLHSLGLISIVGPIDEERPTSASAPAPYVRTQDPEWYAEQAAKLRDELERRRAQLREYRQALEDARSLRETTGGINLDAGRLGPPPWYPARHAARRMTLIYLGSMLPHEVSREPTVILLGGFSP